MIIDSNSFAIREHRASLKREEWDFSSLPATELIPALIWETHREFEKVEEVAAGAQAWLDGNLSDKRPPMQRDKRTGKRPRYNSNFSEAEIARLRASAVFGDFIPHGEFVFLSQWSASRRHREYDRWHAKYIRPLIEAYKTPWLCLPVNDRQRLCGIYKDKRNADVVRILSWWDAVSYFRTHKPDPRLPLKFDFRGRHWDDTTVLFHINWKRGKKRILAAIKEILIQLKPRDVQQENRRGKKDRDLLVILERFAVMRLLHHYTLSEVRRLLPDAWNIYQNRKWYDDRRQALKDFRSIIGYREPERFFPISWKTKAQRSLNALQLPAK